MDLNNIEELIKIGFDRNIICVDKNAVVGNITERLKEILENELIANINNFQKYLDDKLETVGCEFINVSDYTDFYKNLGGDLPLGKKNICFIIARKLIEKYGMKPEYILLGAY